jgi:zinc finger protein
LIPKSDTSGLTIPDIELVLHPGTLGGRFTTVEGILDQVYEELSEKVFTTGDSSTTGLEDKGKFESFLSKLKKVSETTLVQDTDPDRGYS